MTTRRSPARGGQGGYEPRARIRTRERRAIELAVLGWSQHAIAADVGVSQAAVSKILRRVDERVLRELAASVERQKVRQTQRLEYVYAESTRAWETSKTDRTRRRQRKTQGVSATGGATVAEVVSENQHGDPRYLDEARKALADLRKLWGMDAAQKLDVRASHRPYDQMTEEELRAELARQEPLLSDATGSAETPPAVAAGPASPSEDES